MARKLAHIMIIDDEPDILEIARLCLEGVGGFRVTPCAGGRAGIAAALTALPDLILIDVMMPELDGPGTLAHLREHKALDHIPVVFMTARAQPAEVAHYKALGAAGVIAKPFDPMKLSADIVEIWQDIAI